MTPFYLDQTFWIALLTPVLLALSKHFGVNLDPATLVGMVMPILAYIIGHKWHLVSVTNAAIPLIPSATPLVK